MSQKMTFGEAIEYIHNHNNRDKILNDFNGDLAELMTYEDEDKFHNPFITDHSGMVVAEITDSSPDAEPMEGVPSADDMFYDMMDSFTRELRQFVVDEFGSLEKYEEEGDDNEYVRDWALLCMYADENPEKVRPYLLEDARKFLYILTLNESTYVDEAIESIYKRDEQFVLINLLKLLAPQLMQQVPDEEVVSIIDRAYESDTENINETYCREHDLDSIDDSDYFKNDSEKFNKLVLHIVFKHGILFLKVILQKDSKIFTDFIDNY